MDIIHNGFLPVNAAECRERGWDRPDFVYVTGDAYVDHPSFGVSIISRVLEAKGYRVAILSQPDFRSPEAFKEFGRPRLGFLVTAGNIDSMVAHYTVSGHKRNYDYYSPGGKMGLRPDRAVIVYCNCIRQAYGDVPILVGGLEASLRRFAHYDYWSNKVRRSILVDARADILMYGMGENIVIRLAELLDKGVPVKKIRDVRGTVYLCDEGDKLHYEAVGGYDYNVLKSDKNAYAEAFKVQYGEQDAIGGRAVTELYDGKMLVQNPPMPPLEREELDWVYSLPYMRTYHPMYEAMGGVPAIEEVQFSITHNRGCFGGCNFCALAFHQGRTVRSRSHESVLREAEIITKLPGFKGYIHDVGGPTANFRGPACDKQLRDGVCAGRKCLAPTPCKNLKVDHSDYVRLLEKIEAIAGIKKVFIRSGIRFDYLILDKNEKFFKKLVRDHVSGQLKVAPEHCCDQVLALMGKPKNEVYNRFYKRFYEITKSVGKEQYLVPYLISSHPGSHLSDAVALAEYLHQNGYSPEQVQDFYPTPGTASTVMFYTGIDPFTGKQVYVPDDYHEKQMQRALLQWRKPENRRLVLEALRLCGREDLIGTGPRCLVRDDSEGKSPSAGGRMSKGGAPSKRSVPAKNGEKTARSGGATKNGGKAASGRKIAGASAGAREEKRSEKPQYKKGWAKPKAKANARPTKKKK